MTRHVGAAIPILAALAISAVFVQPPDAQAAAAKDLRCRGCVGSKDIGKNAVTSDKIKDKSIKQQDLAKNARPAGAKTFAINGSYSLTASVPASLAEVTVTAPSAGMVLVFASAYVDLNNDTASSVHCSVNNGGDTVSTVEVVVGGNGSQVGSVPFNAHRTFIVTPGSNQFNLVCEETAGTVDIYDVNLTALFVPNML